MMDESEQRKMGDRLVNQLVRENKQNESDYTEAEKLLSPMVKRAVEVAKKVLGDTDVKQ